MEYRYRCLHIDDHPNLNCDCEGVPPPFGALQTAIAQVYWLGMFPFGVATTLLGHKGGFNCFHFHTLYIDDHPCVVHACCATRTVDLRSYGVHE